MRFKQTESCDAITFLSFTGWISKSVFAFGCKALSSNEKVFIFFFVLVCSLEIYAIFLLACDFS
jgi:hypothetical protein